MLAPLAADFDAVFSPEHTLVGASVASFWGAHARLPSTLTIRIAGGAFEAGSQCS